MSRFAAKALVGPLFLWLLSNVVAEVGAQQAVAPWQSSWGRFVETVISEVVANPPDLGEKYAGKEVTWEGTLGAVGGDATTFIRIDMKPDAAQGSRLAVQALCRADEFARWKGLAISSRIRFRGSLRKLPIRSVRVGGPNGTPAILVLVDDARLVEVLGPSK